MTIFVHSESQRLIAAAGGEFKVGEKLGRYFWDICEQLRTVAGLNVRPRSLERAWRGDWMSQPLRDGLEKVALTRAYDDDFQLVSAFEELVDCIDPKTATAVWHIKMLRVCLRWLREILVSEREAVALETYQRIADAIERKRAVQAAE